MDTFPRRDLFRPRLAFGQDALGRLTPIEYEIIMTTSHSGCVTNRCHQSVQQTRIAAWRNLNPKVVEWLLGKQ